jgi:hypothetical protein
MKSLARFLPVIALFLVQLGSSARADAPPGPFFNGFERNTNGWFDSTNGGDGTITRRPSGYSNGGGYADGIASAAGGWHARLVGFPCFTPPNQDCTGPFTRWGGYTSTFPAGGYLTQVDIYLDVSWAATHNDARFDWSSAINQSVPATPPTHRRDWVFNAGTQPAGDLVPGFWVNASTNAFRGSAFPENTCPNPPDPISNPPLGCRMPVKITTSGWYTFRHTFRAGSFTGCPESTCLVVDFDILDHNGAPVPGGHWTIHSSQDPTSMVGGNRYGWFVIEEIPDLAIDNSLRTGLCHNGDGDGDVEGNDSPKAHMHFHKNACDGSKDDVEEDDDNSGSHFQSTSTDSATFTPGEDNQSVTMIGTGLHNGLPVGFTMIAVDNQGLAPAVYTLILTDGYVIIGNVISGGIALQ